MSDGAGQPSRPIVTPPAKNLHRFWFDHGPWIAPAAWMTAVALFIDLSGRRIVFRDTCSILARAVGLVLDGHWPTVGNTIVSGLRLGPATEYMVAAALALTGHIDGAYWLIVIAHLSAIPLFYFAVRPHLPSRLSSAAAVAWFGANPLGNTLLITPWNTSYLPFFLALYTYALMRTTTPWRMAIVYFVIGLCMHFHFTTVFLWPATMVYLAVHRREILTAWWAHAAGIALIALLHTGVWLDYRWSADGAASLGSSLGAGLSAFNPVSALVAALFVWSAGNYPLVLSLAFSLSSRAARRGAPWKQETELALVIAPSLIGIGLAGALFQNMQWRYFYSTLPFVAMLSGLLIDRVVTHASKTRRWVFAILLGAATLGIVAVDFAVTGREHDGESLAANERVADEVYDWLSSRGRPIPARLQTLRFSEYEGRWYWMNPGQEGCLETLLRFRHPGSTFTAGGEAEPYVVVTRSYEGLWSRALFCVPQSPPQIAAMPERCERVSSRSSETVDLCRDWKPPAALEGLCADP